MNEMFIINPMPKKSLSDPYLPIPLLKETEERNKKIYRQSLRSNVAQVIEKHLEILDELRSLRSNEMTLSAYGELESSVQLALHGHYKQAISILRVALEVCVKRSQIPFFYLKKNAAGIDFDELQTKSFNYLLNLLFNSPHLRKLEEGRKQMKIEEFESSAPEKKKETLKVEIKKIYSQLCEYIHASHGGQRPTIRNYKEDEYGFEYEVAWRNSYQKEELAKWSIQFCNIVRIISIIQICISSENPLRKNSPIKTFCVVYPIDMQTIQYAMQAALQEYRTARKRVTQTKHLRF